MADEMVDIVDNSGNITGKGMISFCHKEGLWHRTAGVFVFNDEGEVLVQKRSKAMKTEPGKYDISAGGHVPFGKTSIEAAEVELREELGVTAKLKSICDKDIIQENNFDSQETRHLIRVFKAKHNGLFKIQNSELSSARFFKINKIKEMLSKDSNQFADAFKLCFKEYLKNETY